jgi:betaine-aldehyde dehydrogenase
MIVQDRLFIGGNWAKPAGSDVIEVISPITEEVFGRTPAAIPADIDRAVIAAREAFDAGAWPKMSIAERGEYLLRMGALLEPHAAEAIDLQINEMGAPRKFLHGRIGAFETQVRNAIRTAQSVPTREIRDGVAGNVVVLREPIGVVAAIIPWNGPVSSLLLEVAAGIAHRLRRHHQTCAGDALERLSRWGRSCTGGLAAGCCQHRSGRPGSGPIFGVAPRGG